MPFTLWSFPWSSLWGGGIGSDIPYKLPDPEVSSAGQIIGGVFWLADDNPNQGVTQTLQIESGDSLGWAPGNMDEFAEVGSLTLAFFKDITTIHTYVKLVRSDVDSAVSVLDDWIESPGPAHSELFGDIAITGMAGKSIPAVVMFNDNELFGVSAHNFPLTDLTTPNSSFVWDNELAIRVGDLRFVSLELSGTVIVGMSDSNQYPTQAFFLKPTFGSGTAVPATEILVDLRPSDAYTVVPGRFHVVETHNRVFLFYYEVTDEAGASHVAFFAYTPVHDDFDIDLPYNEGGVVQTPVVVLPNHRPIESQKGARRHPVSNSLVVGVEPEATDEKGLEIHWYATHGYGYTSFGPPEVWNAETHPHLFGGRLGSAAEDRVIRILGVGWSDARQGGDFPILGQLQLNEIPEGAADFRNFYRTDFQSNRVFWRTCLGTLYLPRSPQDSNPGGEHIIRYAQLSTLGHDEFQRGGYHTSSDYLRSVLILQLDSVSAGITPAKKGENGVITGGVVTTSGIVDGAIYLYDAVAAVFVPFFEGLINDGVAVSAWIFPENSGDAVDADSFTIAFQEGGDDIVWRLSWREDVGEFRWRVDTTPGGNAIVSSATLGVLPERHWYHVTGVYDEETELSQLFVNGFLVGEHQFAGDSVLAHAQGEELGVFIGNDTSVISWRAFQGRVDDFVVGKGAGAQQAHCAYQYGLLSKDGLPMRGSRDGVWRYQDQTVATVSMTSGQENGVHYTAGLRRVSMSPHELLRNQLVFDVWKVERGLPPQFTGLVCLPIEAYDRRAAALTETLAAPLVDSFLDSFEMSVSYGQSAPAELYDIWHMVYAVRGDTTGGVTPESVHIYRVRFDPNIPSDLDGTRTDLVARLEGIERISALDIVHRPSIANGNEPSVLAAISDGSPAGYYFYVIVPDDWGVGALAASAKQLVTAFLPPTSAEGSFPEYDYNVDFGSVNHPPYIRGIVSRAVAAGHGFPASVIDSVQVIFGLQSSTGAGLANNGQVVGTVHVLIPADVFETGVFSLFDNGLPRQLDEYGEGGVDPFIPLSWMQNPQGPTGESFLLGRTGNRIYLSGTEFRDGNGGLMLYRLPRQGSWGVRECALAGPYWSANLSQTVGASAVMSVRPGSDTEDAVQVYVSRPHPDREDKFSTVYVSPEEAASGSWVPEDDTIGVIPVLRRNDRVSTILFTGYKLNTRHLTEATPGAALKRGDQYRYAITLRWSYPGSVDFTPEPPPE